MTEPYANRSTVANSDGTPVFATKIDVHNEQDAMVALAQGWDCEIKPFGRLCPVDFYAIRDGRLVAVIESKSRTHNSNAFPTVFLNVRKWLALSLASVGLGVPAIFVVDFADGVRKWININGIDVGKVSIAGCRQTVKSHTDIEPVIEVPVAKMHQLGTNNSVSP